jgi:ATP-dependent protease ClpP protease subunit
MDNQFHLEQLKKPYDGQATYRKSLAHLIWMAGLKGAKQYAWQRAKQLDSDPSGMYRGIADDLTKAMNETSGKN